MTSRTGTTTSTRRTALALLVAAPLLTLLVSCGSDDPTSGSGGGTVSQSTPGDTTSPSEDADQAVSVSFSRSGGLKPTGVMLVYAADSPPPDGTSKAELDDILAAASDPALRTVHLTKLPANTCCDRQEYLVTITYADGSTKAFRTLDGLQQPAVFESLLSMLG